MDHGFSLMYVVGAAAIWGMMPDGSNLWFGLSPSGSASSGRNTR